MIEKALEAGGRRVDSKYTVNQLATTRRGRDAVVYKMHGDIEHPSEAILSKDDYERYSLSHGPFITALSSDLIQKTFLFLGFSFTDPNLDFVLSRIPAHPQLRVYDVVWLSSDSGGHSLFGIRFSERKLNSLVHEHHHAED